MPTCNARLKSMRWDPCALSTPSSPVSITAQKIGIVTSRMGSITDNTSGRLYGYRMSKAAANMLGASLAQDLKERGIAVALLHPGMVNTQLVPNLPESVRDQLIEPEEAARGLLARMDALTLETTGKFWHANGEVLPW